MATSWVGVNENSVPVYLKYGDGGLFWVTCSAGRSLYGNQQLFAYGIGWAKGDGLTCHSSCYWFLYQGLGYKLHLRDVQPLLERGRNSDLLQSDYGSLKNYHCQVGHHVHMYPNCYTILPSCAVTGSKAISQDMLQACPGHFLQLTPQFKAHTAEKSCCMLHLRIDISNDA